MERPAGTPALQQPSPVSLAIVVPWRTDGGHRERLWQHLQPQWRDAAAELGADVVPVDDGQAPFSVARIMNTCMRGLDHDTVMIYGADQFPHVQAVREAHERILGGWAWSHVFGSVGYLTAGCSEAILNGDDVEEEFAETLPLAPGLLMYRRDVWLDINGYDERFSGWGYGDTAQIDALNTMHPIPAGYPNHKLVELWHQPTLRVRSAANPNYHVYRRRYAPAVGNPDLMRQVVNEWSASVGQE